ncbi:MAG: low molecular weight phosphotyrosine protein phosphatase [Bacteroidetes bacterium]|jgi:protein-tyrosine phosphatase|nr:low molecular weight phosphotyrosine protein phosphatase [Bacteroidota bacterium]
MATQPETDQDFPIRVNFVCLGNICRSPLAENIFRSLVEQAGLEAYFDVLSSGTGRWHVGEQADARMRQTAQEHDLSLEDHRAQQFQAEDLAAYDHIFTMDKSNLKDVLALDGDDTHGHKVRLFREFDPEPEDYQVPDPYYGGADGFENVYGIVERTARMLLHRLVEEHDLEDEMTSSPVAEA